MYSSLEQAHSKACGLPLTNELLPGVLPSLQPKSFRRQAQSFIKYLYPYFDSDWGNYPNIEALLSLMDVYVEFSRKVKSSHRFDPAEVKILQHKLLGAISVRLSQLSAKIRIRDTQFFRLATILRPGDVVITFN